MMMMMTMMMMMMMMVPIRDDGDSARTSELGGCDFSEKHLLGVTAHALPSLECRIFNEKHLLEATAHALRSLEGAISLENTTAGSDSTRTSERSGHTEHQDARSHLGSSHIGPKLDRAALV